MMHSNSLSIRLLLSVCLGAAATVHAQQTQPVQATGVPAKGKELSVLVAYYSRSGNTKRVAEGVVEGGGRVPGVKVNLKPVDEVTQADLDQAQGLILGCPTHFGSIPGHMKTVIDNWSWQMKVDFTDKVGGAFSTGGGQAGGKELVVMSLMVFMVNNRMLVAGPLYRNELTGSIWGEIGASAMTGPLDPGVREEELDGARRLGERIARLVKRIHGGG